MPKNQENLNLNEKRQSTDTATEIKETLELLEEGFKAAILKAPQRAIRDVFETNENIESLIKEIKDRRTK